MDTSFRHRMWSLYVRSDQVDQQIVEIDWIYLLLIFPPLSSAFAAPPEVVWGAVMSVLIPNSTAASKHLDMLHCQWLQEHCSPITALWQFNFPVRKGKKTPVIFWEIWAWLHPWYNPIMKSAFHHCWFFRCGFRGFDQGLGPYFVLHHKQHRLNTLPAPEPWRSLPTLSRRVVAGFSSSRCADCPAALWCLLGSQDEGGIETLTPCA